MPFRRGHPFQDHALKGFSRRILKTKTLLLPAAVALRVAAGSDAVLSQTIDAAASAGIYEGLYLFGLDQVPPEFDFDGSTQYGAVDAGQTAAMTRVLAAGTRQIIAVQCEPDDCQAVRLHILDENDAVVIADTPESGFASVRFDVAETQDYTIAVTVTACSANPCHFGVDIYSTPTP